MKYKDVGNQNFSLTSCRKRKEDSILNVELKNISMQTASDFFNGGTTGRSNNLDMDLGKMSPFERKRIS